MTGKQLALPIILDRWTIRAAGPTGGSSYRLGQWLDRWRGVENVRILGNDVEIIVVPADAPLERDGRTAMFSLLGSF